MLNSLGSEVHLVVRKAKALREFDPMISDGLDVEMTKAGIMIHRHTNGVAKVTLAEAGKTKKNVTLHSGDTIYGADVVLMAAGRVPNLEDLCDDCDWSPNTEVLKLESCGVKITPKKYVIVDEYQNTNVENIYALGDVCGTVELTPMAIAAGRRLADRLFSGKAEDKVAKVSYDLVPTVVFSHPVSCILYDDFQYMICLHLDKNSQMHASIYHRLLELVASLNPKQLKSMARRMLKCTNPNLVISFMEFLISSPRRSPKP